MNQCALEIECTRHETGVVHMHYHISFVTWAQQLFHIDIIRFVNVFGGFSGALERVGNCE